MFKDIITKIIIIAFAIMTPLGSYNFFVYIITNRNKTVLYTGVTNDIAARLCQHREESLGSKSSFAGRYSCIYLVYYEYFDQILHAIDREKQIKGWSRKKKEKIISDFNPEWKFLNDQIKDL